MDRYGYVISREGLSSGGKPRRYAKQDLELMTTHQLREICRTERIISGVTDPLDKDDLIRVILRYRGADEHLLITRHSAEGMEALQRMVSRVHLHLQTDVRLTCNASIAVYRGCAVGYYDRLTIPYDARLAGTNVLVVSGGQICGILNLVAKGTDTDLLYLTKSTELPCRESPVRDYSLYCMDRAHSAILYRIYNGDYGYLPEHLNVYRIPLLDFSVREPVELNIPLAIDFGTSSTTAGVYLDDLYFERIGMQPGQLGLLANQPNYAVFYDVTQDFRETPLLPSVVGVRSVGNGQPRFLFGYEAVRFAGSSYIDEGFCVFYDIKRWVRDPEKSEEIADREGRRASIPRKQILRAYFEYLIREVCSRFKCRVSRIHLSSPAKQKHLFQQLFSDLLPNYAVEQDGMLDEGMSVLYNTISGMIVQGKTREGAEYRALVLDCGGGTTDLCSCRFRVSNRRVSYRIDLQAAYENGDTDFGGNNLTYRIMQLLKVRLAEQLGELPAGRSEALLEAFDLDVFRYVDANGAESLYQELDAAYHAAEQVVPTRFREYETLSRADYYKVKNNFYLLFDAAERIKKAFYSRPILQVALSSRPAEDTSGTCLPVDRWKLTVRTASGLQTVREFPEIGFSIHEINRLLKGDIYGIVRRFLEPMYESGELEDYAIIRLTGQSCRIELFRDALKEFVPGRMIRSRRSAGGPADDLELKTACVNGALNYLKDRKYGFADVSVRSEPPALPYRITAYTHTGSEVTLIHGLQRSEDAGHISRNMDDLTLQLYLKDMDGRVRHSFSCHCGLEEFREVSDEEIRARYEGKIPQRDTDDIVDREVRFFVWARPLRWGYLVVPVYRNAERLMLGREQFFPFEQDGWVLDFFDGTK